MEKPLVSFNIICYNQEAFVREALEGAFAQTYSPLEIVISDDCSSDRTFEIIQQMVATYRGPHTIRLNRNKTNLGLAANCNQAAPLCRGELVVGAAGDDISLPERTSVIVKAWNDSGRKATSLCSRFSVIDERGMVIEEAAQKDGPGASIQFFHRWGTIREFIRRRLPHVAGCAHASSRSLYQIFGPFPEKIDCEDTILAFRTILAGGMFTFIEAPLVKYRRHGGNITFDLEGRWRQSCGTYDEVQEKRRRELERMIEVYACFSTDAERAMRQGLISQVKYPAVQKAIKKEARRFVLKRELLHRGWLGRLSVFFQLYCNTVRPREMLTQLPHLLPRRTVYRARSLEPSGKMF